MTRRTISLALWWVVVIWAAHALAFGTMRLLPDPVYSALGFASAQPAARSSFATTHPPRGYFETLGDLTSGDLGTTVDGVPVAAEVGRSLEAGWLRLLAALVLVVLVIILTGYAPEQWLQTIGSLSGAVGFLPPFVASFVGLGLFLSLPPSWLSWGGPLIAVLAIAIPPAALAASQAARVTARNLASPFALTLRAVGYARRNLRRRLLFNLAVELAPTVEKLVLGLLTSALFAESILGLDGFGSLMLRAIRRADADLLLAVVLLLAIISSTLSLATRSLRASAGMPVR